MNESLASLLEAVADTDPSAIALIHAGECRTWADLDIRASRLAAYLGERGVAQGDRVGIDLYNGLEYLETLFAVMKLRAVPINVNYRYREAELEYVLTDASATALIFHQSLSAQVGAVCERQPALVAVCVADHSEGDVDGAADYSTVVASGPVMQRVERDGGDHLIVYTGGTTGMPKGAVWSHAKLADRLVGQPRMRAGLPMPATPAEVGSSACELRRAAPLVTLPVPPLMHSTAMIRALTALLAGGTVVIPTHRSFDPLDVLALVARHGVTELVITGDVMAKPMLTLLDEAATDGMPIDLTSLRTITSSGVTFSETTKIGLVAHGGFAINDVIASTEGGPFAIGITASGSRLGDTKFRLTPNARIIGEDLAIAGTGQPGRLAATGSQPDEYLGDPEKSANTWIEIDGERWVVPGDYAILESDGTVRLLGRGSEVINSGGEKIYTEEVQSAITADHRVADAIVLGLPDERWGQRVAAVVALKPDYEMTAADVGAVVSAVLSDFKKPRQVAFVSEIRRNPVGKADLAWATALLAET